VFLGCSRDVRAVLEPGQVSDLLWTYSADNERRDWLHTFRTFITINDQGTLVLRLFSVDNGEVTEEGTGRLQVNAAERTLIQITHDAIKNPEGALVRRFGLGLSTDWSEATLQAIPFSFDASYKRTLGPGTHSSNRILRPSERMVVWSQLFGMKTDEGPFDIAESSRRAALVDEWWGTYRRPSDTLNLANKFPSEIIVYATIEIE
jgi:hypothetical protein